jgi:hypothetical protein
VTLLSKKPCAQTGDTYALSSPDLAYIDMTTGPLTNISLLDGFEMEAEALSKQPTIFLEYV